MVGMGDEPGKPVGCGKSGSGGFWDGVSDVFGGDDTGFGEGGGGEGIVSEEVDFSGEAVCGLEDGFEGLGFKEWEVAAGETEEVSEVGWEFIAGEAGEVVSDDDAL